jgi:hypothetical protein
MTEMNPGQWALRKIQRLCERQAHAGEMQDEQLSFTVDYIEERIEEIKAYLKNKNSTLD